MPLSRLEDLRSPTSRGWPSAEGRFRAAHWGDTEVCLTTVDGPLDCTEMHKLGGSPGGVRPCPHYFYVFEGRIRCIWPGSDMPDEVVSAGEACYFPRRPRAGLRGSQSRARAQPRCRTPRGMDAMERAAQRR